MLFFVYVMECHGLSWYVIGRHGLTAVSLPTFETDRTAAQIDRDIKHFAADRSHQLSLGICGLIVQAPQNSVF